MTDKGEKPNRGFVSDQAWDSVNELVNIYRDEGKRQRKYQRMPDEPTDWTTSDSAIATTLNFQTALSVTCLEKITFQLGTGVRISVSRPEDALCKP